MIQKPYQITSENPVIDLLNNSASDRLFDSVCFGEFVVASEFVLPLTIGRLLRRDKWCWGFFNFSKYVVLQTNGIPEKINIIKKNFKWNLPLRNNWGKSKRLAARNCNDEL